MNQDNPASKKEGQGQESKNSVDLPDFNALVKLSNEDPEALEKLRKKLAEDLIRQAPKDTQRRLRGLQFKIDMERRRAKTPMAACMKMSEMMQHSFLELRDALNSMAHLKKQMSPKAHLTPNSSMSNKSHPLNSTGKPLAKKPSVSRKMANVIAFPQPQIDV